MSRPVAVEGVLCLAILLSAFTPLRIVAEDHLEGSALELAPIDTATFISSHRHREQLDLLLNSRAFQRFVATNNSLISFIRMRMGLTDGKDIEGWKEAVADEFFLYAGATFTRSFIEFGANGPGTLARGRVPTR